MAVFMSMLSQASIIPVEVRNIIEPILLIIICLLSIGMIIAVLKQDGDPENLGALTGGSETYYSQNKSKGRDGFFKKLTIGIAISIVVIAILYFVLKVI